MGHLEPRFRAHAIHGALLLKLTRDVLENFIGFTEIQSIAIMRGIKQLKKAHRKGTRARREAKLEVPLYKYAKENDPRAGNATPDNVPVVGVSTPVETGFLRTATCISTQSTQRTMSEAEATAAYQPHPSPGLHDRRWHSGPQMYHHESPAPSAAPVRVDVAPVSVRPPPTAPSYHAAPENADLHSQNVDQHHDQHHDISRRPREDAAPLTPSYNHRENRSDNSKNTASVASTSQIYPSMPSSSSSSPKSTPTKKYMSYRQRQQAQRRRARGERGMRNRRQYGENR